LLTVTQENLLTVSQETTLTVREWRSTQNHNLRTLTGGCLARAANWARKLLQQLLAPSSRKAVGRGAPGWMRLRGKSWKMLSSNSRQKLPDSLSRCAQAMHFHPRFVLLFHCRAVGQGGPRMDAAQREKLEDANLGLGAEVARLTAEEHDHPTPKPHPCKSYTTLCHLCIWQGC
jgi:hypothetical protein